MCRQRAVSSIQEGTLDSVAFLDTVTSNRKNTWVANISINDQLMSFKLDTGAEVTVISKEAWEILGKPALQSPRQQLVGPAIGQFAPTRGRKLVSKSSLLTASRQTSLAFPAINALTMAVRIDSCEGTTVSLQERYPKVFQGLWSLPHARTS